MNTFNQKQVAKSILVGLALVVCLILVCLDGNAASTETSAIAGADAAIVCCKLIGWGGFLLVLALLRGFITTALALALRDVLQNVSPQTLATLAHSLYLKHVISQELLQRVEELEATATNTKKR
jgi:hypothetical protein